MRECLPALWPIVLLVSVGLYTWASIGHLHGLGWQFVGGGQVPWPSSLARGPYGWAQVATFVITGLLIVILAIAVRDQPPQKRMSGVGVVLLVLLGVALILAAFRVDTPTNPTTWHGWVHGIAFLGFSSWAEDQGLGVVPGRGW